jgi:phosphoenolpyruvate carboxykinase (ATP)
MPTSCPGVPSDVLNPKNTWEDKADYDKKAKTLASEFVKNFEKYESDASEEVKDAAPIPH